MGGFQKFAAAAKGLQNHYGSRLSTKLSRRAPTRSPLTKGTAPSLRERGEHANKFEIDTGPVLKQVSLNAVEEDVSVASLSCCTLEEPASFGIKPMEAVGPERSQFIV